MPYNVISSLCIADPSPMGSAIFWAHVNKIKINQGKRTISRPFEFKTYLLMEYRW